MAFWARPTKQGNNTAAHWISGHSAASAVHSVMFKNASGPFAGNIFWTLMAGGATLPRAPSPLSPLKWDIVWATCSHSYWLASVWEEPSAPTSYASARPSSGTSDCSPLTLLDGHKLSSWPKALCPSSCIFHQILGAPHSSTPFGHLIREVKPKLLLHRGSGRFL